MTENARLLGRRVLVVEADINAADLLAEMLEASGAVLAGIAFTAKEAMKAADVDPDGAVVALRLPDGDTFSVIGRLQEAGIPIVLISGFDEVLPEQLFGLPRLVVPFNSSEFNSVVVPTFLARKTRL